MSTSCAPLCRGRHSSESAKTELCQRSGSSRRYTPTCSRLAEPTVWLACRSLLRDRDATASAWLPLTAALSREVCRGIGASSLPSQHSWRASGTTAGASHHLHLMVRAPLTAAQQGTDHHQQHQQRRLRQRRQGGQRWRGCNTRTACTDERAS